MSAGDRFINWIDSTASLFADRLGTWFGTVLSAGGRKTLDELEPGVIDQIREALLTIRNTEGIPGEYKDIIDKSLEEGNLIEVVLGWLFVVVGLIPAILSIGSVPAKSISYMQEIAAKTYRLDPISVMTAWRRDPTKYAQYFHDLEEQGWSADRLEALKEITLVYPTPQEVVSWLAREVFEPEMIAKYGLDDEYEGLELSLFDKIGIPRENVKNFWRAHWEHASWNQIVEMLRRGLISEDDVWEWFRVVEIVPYWRDKLMAVSWAVPTRVDVRRFWDMRTIDEARLRQIYTAMGYHDQDLEDYVLWTKIYVDFPDLITRYKNGWLTVDQVKEALLSLGMSTDRAEELIQTKVKAATSEKLAKERDLTMSQIVKGVKKAVISRDEGAELLMEMGYDEYEALFILAIEIPQDEVVTEVKFRELTKSDILNGLKAGTITEGEALEKLIELRYTQDDAQFILDIYIATVTAPEEPKAREASKADIVKAVKTGLITAEDGYLMLQDIGFTPEASQFILLVQAESSPFSPVSYREFKDLTGQWRKVVSPAGKTEPEEIRQAGIDLVEKKKDVDALEKLVKAEELTLVDADIVPAEVKHKLSELRDKLYKAQADYDLAQSNYNGLVARWRQQED